MRGRDRWRQCCCCAAAKQAGVSYPLSTKHIHSFTIHQLIHPASAPTCLPRHPSKVAVLADVVKGLQALPHAAVDVDGDDLAPAGQGQGRRRGPVSGWVDEEPGEDAGWPNETLHYRQQA